MKKPDLTGQRFGRGLVIASLDSREGRRYWKLQCDCGNSYEAYTNLLRRGGVKSCGCAKREVRTHGPRVRVPELAAKFRAALLSGDPNGCWIKTPGPLETPCWLWSLPCSGYGYLCENGKNIGAHRFAWRTANGEIPAGLCVLHKCDVRRCVRPSHLFLGTKHDNIKDASRKRRLLSGERWKAAHADTVARGERNGCAKLTESCVIEIYDARDRGETLAAIAARLGISTTQVSNAHRGKTWKHLAYLSGYRG